MTLQLNAGNIFKLTDDAIENYGEQWRDIVFTVTSWTNHYVPAKEFYANPLTHVHGHPGYDSSMGKQRLYDAVPINSDLEFNCSVYDFEIEQA